MKTRKIIYITIGSILIILNLLVNISEFGTARPTKEGTGFSIGYFIGSHILLIFGLILLRMAYRLNKKLKKKEIQELINKIGQPD